MRIKRTHLIALIFLVVTCSLPACGSKDNEDDSDDEELQIDGESDGELSGVDLVLQDLENVEDGMVPESLAVDDDTASLLLNPCEGIDVIACQPNLLKLYLSLGKSMVGEIHKIVKDTSKIVNALSGQTGEKKINEDDIAKVEYKIESSKSYAFILHSELGAFVHLAVNRTGDEKKYELLLNGSNAPASDGDENEEDGPAFVSIKLEFSGKKSFNLELVLSEMECQSSDVGAPSAITIKISRTSEGHYGKAVTYHPRWMGDNTCSSNSSTLNEMSIMTDFAGNDDGSTASFYMANRTTKIADIDAWELSDFCTQFSDDCDNGSAFGSSNEISTYGNPACMLASSSSWNNECPAFSALDYTSSDEWTTPDTLRTLSNSFPSDPILIE